MEDTGKTDITISPDGNPHAVGPLHQPEHGLQLVIAVGAAPQDVQEEIQLPWRGIERYFHSEMASRSSIPG